MTNKISNGVAHKVPIDLKRALAANKKALTVWEYITPLARNEWLCWIESVKKSETREWHIQRAVAELKQGKHRPCCWGGCPHRQNQKTVAQ